MSSKPAVCVLDDDADVRSSLKLLFRSRNIPFLAFGTLEEFLEGYTQKNVGCILLDYKLSGTTGLNVLRELRAKNILIPVILITGHADVPLSVEAMKAGACDVIEKPFDDADLVKRVQAAFAKSDLFRKLSSERAEVEIKMGYLTPREIEVLDMMVAGVKNRKIAQELGISSKTLDIHRANIFKKMSTKTVADLVRWRLISQTDTSGVAPVIVREPVEA